MTGVQKTIEMRLLDDTLQKRVGSGIAVKSSFPVHPDAMWCAWWCGIPKAS